MNGQFSFPNGRVYYAILYVVKILTGWLEWSLMLGLAIVATPAAKVVQKLHLVVRNRRLGRDLGSLPLSYALYSRQKLRFYSAALTQLLLNRDDASGFI
jgi:hypothetical protein